MRLLIATDAWRPQINGVTRTLERTIDELSRLGVNTSVLAPSEFHSLPCPTEPSVRLAIPRGVGKILEQRRPDAIHILTEGPVGWTVRAHCLRERIPFTTSYCTAWPEYLQSRLRFPTRAAYAVMRRFHQPARRTTVATPGLEAELADRGFTNLARWSRGVDTERFHPRPLVDFLGLPRPIHLYVGRVAAEKNLERFLELSLDGTKLVVGDGPERVPLAAKFPDVRFLGSQTGETLANTYAQADVFVFPSVTDTFGLVVLEALASGVPVAAFPVTAPKGILGDSGAGALDHDLGAAIDRALAIPRERCRELAIRYSWRAASQQLLDVLEPIRRPQPSGVIQMVGDLSGDHRRRWRGAPKRAYSRYVDEAQRSPAATRARISCDNSESRH